MTRSSKIAAVALMALLVGSFAKSVSAKPSCAAWQAAAVQREEGKALTASVCASGPDRGKVRDSILEIVCHRDRVNVRFLAVIENDAPPKYDKQDVIFKTKTAERRVFMQYEGLDGAFTAYLPPAHPLFEALMSGDTVDIAPAKEQLPTPAFTLRGSRAAISRVIAQCR